MNKLRLQFIFQTPVIYLLLVSFALSPCPVFAAPPQAMGPVEGENIPSKIANHDPEVVDQDFPEAWEEFTGDDSLSEAEAEKEREEKEKEYDFVPMSAAQMKSAVIRLERVLEGVTMREEVAPGQVRRITFVDHLISAFEGLEAQAMQETSVQADERITASKSSGLKERQEKPQALKRQSAEEAKSTQEQQNEKSLAFSTQIIPDEQPEESDIPEEKAVPEQTDRNDKMIPGSTGEEDGLIQEGAPAVSEEELPEAEELTDSGPVPAGDEAARKTPEKEIPVTGEPEEAIVPEPSGEAGETAPAGGDSDTVVDKEIKADFQIVTFDLTVPITKQVEKVIAQGDETHEAVPEEVAKKVEEAEVSGTGEIIVEGTQSEVEAEVKRFEDMIKLLKVLDEFLIREMRREIEAGDPEEPREEKVDRALERFFDEMEGALDYTVGYIRDRFMPAREEKASRDMTLERGRREDPEVLMANRMYAPELAVLLPEELLQMLEINGEMLDGAPDDKALNENRLLESENPFLRFFYFYKNRHPWLTILVNRHMTAEQWRYIAEILEEIYQPHSDQEIDLKTRNTRQQQVSLQFIMRFIPLSQVFVSEMSPVVTRKPTNAPVMNGQLQGFKSPGEAAGISR